MFFMVREFSDDPCVGKLVSLLHMNGTDGSTAFTDVTGKTWTASGNAQIDTAQSKFGGASGLFDGTGDWIDTPDHADFTLGSGNFTVEFWARFNTVGGAQQNIAGQSNSLATNATTSFVVSRNTSNQIAGVCGSGVTVIGLCTTAPATVTTGQWYHIAFVRNGTAFNVYLDGVAGTTSSLSSASVNDSANKVAIGRQGELNSNFFNGWIDDFRILKCARYTANFTPPTAEFPDS